MPLGSILSAFGSTDYSPIHAIAGAGAYERDLLAKQKRDQPWYDTQLENYNAGVAAAEPRVAAERGAARSDLQGLFTQNQNYDPYAGATGYQNNLFKNYSDLAKSVPDWTTKNLDLNAFNLGLGGRPSSSYYAPAISRNIAAQLFPAISSGVSTIPGLAATAEASRASNLGRLQDIIGQRSATATQGMDLPLAPLQARLGLRNAQSGALQNLNTAAQSGIAGWQANPDLLSRLGTAASGEEAALGSMMGGAEGGGGGSPSMGGGEGGGGGSGGGGSAPAASGFIPSAGGYTPKSTADFGGLFGNRGYAGLSY